MVLLDANPLLSKVTTKTKIHLKHTNID
ncbi:hypothetical protein CRENPOLYSF1_670029 [Crenothrix polyspora]|uniref:Uncharacterized protein n=1 Tax=Crenothrix polyspora TaxID=360316 RepID=A0A1R4HGC2_9GAMM|nr:hypothetical protein CRENPOLYSF1_670029 [Crenothrix polyspora]